MYFYLIESVNKLFIMPKYCLLFKKRAYPNMHNRQKLSHRTRDEIIGYREQKKRRALRNVRAAPKFADVCRGRSKY